MQPVHVLSLHGLPCVVHVCPYDIEMRAFRDMG